MALFDPAVARLMGMLPALAARSVDVTRWLDDEDARPPRDDLHLHAIPTLYVCLHGAARVDGHRRRLDLVAGDAVVIAPGVWHAHPLPRGASVTLDLGLLAGVCDLELTDARSRLWGRVPPQPYRMYLERLLAEPRNERRRTARALFAALAQERVDAMDFAHPAQRAMAYRMWSNGPWLDARDILAASGLGPRRAHALFTAFFATTPKRALIAQRLALAERFLDAGLAVAEAARRAGFRRRADLTRAWRIAHGRPPTG